MDSFDTVFSDFGGPSGVAAALNIPESHARTMKARGSIPVEHWDRLIRAAEEKGLKAITWSNLQALRKAKREGQAA